MRKLGKKVNIRGFLIRIIILLSITSAAAIWGANWYFSNLEQDVLMELDFFPVIVAAQDLQPGHNLRKQDLAVAELPKSGLVRGNYPDSAYEEIIGKKLCQPIQKGEQITQVKLLNENEQLTGHGKRWYLLKESYPNDGFPLSSGDRVDVICVLPQSDGKRESAVILQNILIAEVLKPNSSSYGMDDNNQRIILETSLKEAQRLALAQELGAIKLVKRSSLDLAVVPITKTNEDEILGKRPLISPVQYRRIEVINGVESESIYLPIQGGRR